MKSILRNYPIAGIALLLLACVRFEYQTSSWAISSPGLAGGVAVLAIVAIVLLFRIFNAAQDACISRGLLRSRIQCKYDILIPIGTLAALINFRSTGEPFHGAGKSGYRWEFARSDPGWAVPFLAGLIGVVLLVRVLHLVRAIAENPRRSS